MADVRSLLRAERAARAPAKQSKKAAQLPSAASNDRKRKAGDEDQTEDARKRSRADDHASVAADLLRQSGIVREASSDEQGEEGQDAVTARPQVAQKPVIGPIAGAKQRQSEPTVEVPPKAREGPVDEDEWAAFERDMATPPPQSAPTQSMPAAAATAGKISAAPLTADELAAQAVAERNAQRTKRDEDVAGEKEDAERALEDEFEEMEELEKRVQRLKEMREKVRSGQASRVAPEVIVEEPPDQKRGSDIDEDDDDDEDFDDGWTFRPG